MSSAISGTGQAPTSSWTGSVESSSSSPEPGRDRTGRDGFLDLAFERRGSRTILTRRRFTLPLQALEPVDLEDGGAATLFLLNPTGGVLGGDRLDTRVELGAGAWVCLSTPSATRVYRSGGAPSVQRVTVRVGAGARLEYLPDHVIPSPGARLVQSLQIELEPGASAILCDAWSAGRVARDETWLFELLDSDVTVRDAEGLLFKDRLVLTSAHGWGGLGGAEDMAYVATLLCVAPSHPRLAELAPVLTDHLALPHGAARAGVTPLARGGALVRILAASAPAMQQTIARAWAAYRNCLWGLPPKALRKT